MQKISGIYSINLKTNFGSSFIVTFFSFWVDNLEFDYIISLVMRMTVKKQVLKILENNRDCYISGNDIAKELFVSRNAVWKAVNGLKNDGYTINSVTNKGYMLSADTDIVSAESISKYLKYNLDITVLSEIDSTNNYLKKLASDGEKEGKLVVACKQTKGKGRMGRSFYSPDNTGIYFSLLLRPKYSAEKSLFLTVMAAVAVAETAMVYSDADIKIKWVNDVYANGKKLCGILTEGSVSLENNGLDYAVIGIGVNVTAPESGFPDDIKNTATSVFPGNRAPGDAKSRIAGEVVNRILDMYYGKDTDYISRYQKMSFLDGKAVNIINSDTIEPAVVIRIDENCRLVVKKENGEIKTLSSGDVSVRVK